MLNKDPESEICMLCLLFSTRLGCGSNHSQMCVHLWCADHYRNIYTYDSKHFCFGIDSHVERSICTPRSDLGLCLYFCQQDHIEIYYDTVLPAISQCSFKIIIFYPKLLDIWEKNEQGPNNYTMGKLCPAHHINITAWRLCPLNETAAVCIT